MLSEWFLIKIYLDKKVCGFGFVVYS
jgi:hypothetical protein